MKWLLLLIGSLGVLRADSVTLYPVADTALFENDPDNNFGGVGELPGGATRMGKRGRVLLKFDVAAVIPSNSIISSASLTVKVQSTPSAPFTNSVFDLRRMLQPWAEGNKSASSHGGPASPGESTWRAQFAPQTLWSAPGGAAAKDFSTNRSASTEIAGAGSYTFASTSDLVSDVQSWLQNPLANFGWILMSESESVAKTARRFGSRETLVRPRINKIQLVNGIVSLEFKGGTPGNAPALAVEFTAPGTSTASPSNTVEFKDSWGAAPWQTLTNVAFQASPLPITMHDGVPSNPQRFYRIRFP